MENKDYFVPAKLKGVVESLTHLGTNSITGSVVELNTGAMFIAPRRFGTKVEVGDDVTISPKVYRSKRAWKGGIHIEAEQDNARWVQVVRGEKVVTKFDIPITHIIADQ